MEASKVIPVAEGRQEYDLPSNFKVEFDDGFRFSSAFNGDLLTPLVKMTPLELDQFTDYDETSDYPTDYYLNHNDTTNNRKLNIWPKPEATDYSTTLGVGTTTTSFSNTAFSYLVNGVSTAKAANLVGTAFSAANTINTAAAAGIFWGGWLVQISSAGTITTKPCGGLSNQVYTSKDATLAALPDADTNNSIVGYIVVAATTGADWVANTDVLTSGTGNTSVTFYNATAMLNLRYYKYLDALSSVSATFDTTTDMISIECPQLVIWLCVEELIKLRDPSLLQVAQRQITVEADRIFTKDWKYKKANYL